MEKKAFVAAMREYFGPLPGQSTKDFADDLKTLSFEEKVQFADMLNGAGVPCEPPKPSTTSPVAA